MICPNCGHELSDHATLCPYCWSSWNNIKNDARKANRYCVHCGREIPVQSAFCIHCGQAQPTKEESSVRPPDEAKNTASSAETDAQAETDTSDRPFGANEANKADKTTAGEAHSNTTAAADSEPSLDSVPPEPGRRKPLSSSKMYARVIGIGVLVVIGAVVIGWLIWTSANFPGAGFGAVLECMSVSNMTTEVPLGGTFDQSDLAITPVKVTYTSNEVYYDEYGEPYASIVLDITCLAWKWQPKYENIMFWLDGSAAFSQPDYDRAEIKRGETVRYTFTQPLITSSTKDVEMRLTLECKTGASVELYFSVNDIQDFFNGVSASGPDPNDWTNGNQIAGSADSNGEKSAQPESYTITYNPVTHIQRTALNPRGYNLEIYYEIPVFEINGVGYSNFIMVKNYLCLTGV